MKNIGRVIGGGLKVLPRVAKKFEIIVVNDGSEDATEDVVRPWLRETVRLVNHKQNMGYGMALRTGIKAARYKWTFWTDGDGQFDWHQLLDFLPYADKYDAIIGYRKNRAEGFKREINTRLYNLAVNTVFGLRIRDYDCAFKLIRSEKLKELKLDSTGAFTSAEIVFLLDRNGIRFKELPVKHLPRLYGKPTGNSLRVIVKAFREAATIRWKHQKQG